MKMTDTARNTIKKQNKSKNYLDFKFLFIMISNKCQKYETWTRGETQNQI